MSASALQALRVAAVVALLGAAAALATPPGRLPAALRGLSRLMGRGAGGGGAVPVWRRGLAFLMVLAAAALCMA